MFPDNKFPKNIDSSNERLPVRLFLLCLSLFEELYVTQCVGRRDATDRTDTVRGIAYLLIRIENKICRVDNLSTLLPECADLVGISRDFEPIRHRKSELQFVDGLFGF